MINTIYYVGNFKFPNGNAAGKRVYANSLLFQSLGYKVIVVGYKKTEEKFDQKSPKINNITFYNFDEKKDIISKIFNYKSQIKQIKKIIHINTFGNSSDLLIYYGTPSISLFNMKLIKFCKKSGLLIISDCVDWLSIRTKNPIFNFIKSIDNLYLKSYLNKKTDGIIVISKFLQKYYKSAKYPILRLPPLSTTKPISSNASSNLFLKMVYAGQIFRKNEKNKNPETLKDRIDIVMESLYLLKKSGTPFNFLIYGFSKEEYLRALPLQKSYVDALSNEVFFYGNVDNETVESAIEGADFSILIRKITKESTAGFPTKVSESISCGTPVVINETSDLKDYIVDGYNGYFVDYGVKSLYMKLLELSKLNVFQKNILKENCKNTDSFQVSYYRKDTESFLKDIINMNDGR